MALGEDLGYAVRLTQNNSSLYIGGAGMHSVHIALMGDPTLRVFIVKPPVGLMARRLSANRVDLSWGTSTDTVLGYHIYRSTQTNGSYTRQTSTPVTATTFTDNQAGGGRYSYLVRAVKLETSAGGTFYNLSPGVIDSVTTAAGAIAAAGSRRARVLMLEPVDHDGVLRFSCTTGQGGPARIAVLDLSGKIMADRRVVLTSGSAPLSLNLAGTGWGVYVLLIETNGGTERARFVYQKNR
jgi:hypothetical protein